MPCRPSTSQSRTSCPSLASASASDAATVVLPVPPLPVTTCSFTRGKSGEGMAESVATGQQPPSAWQDPAWEVLRVDKVVSSAAEAAADIADGATLATGGF